MAQVSIHQDLYGYERKRYGLTSRQIAGMLTGAVLALCICGVALYALQLPISVAVTCGLMFAALPIVCGFAPIWGMPAEEWFMRLEESRERGPAVCFDGEELDNIEGRRSRAYEKQARRKGAEARDYGAQAEQTAD